MAKQKETKKEKQEKKQEKKQTISKTEIASMHRKNNLLKGIIILIAGIIAIVNSFYNSPKYFWLTIGILWIIIAGLFFYLGRKK